MKNLVITFALIASSFCCRRAVDLSINGHKSEYLTAKVEKTNASWKVSAYLPIGNWQAKLENEQAEVKIDSSGPRPIAYWFISTERMHQSRPMRLDLFNPNGRNPVATLELKPLYPGEKFIEGVLKVVYWAGHPGIRY